MAKKQEMHVCLWFDNQADAAAKFYTGIFKDSRIISTAHYGKEGFEVHHRPAGSVMTVKFELNGLKFTALNGGPEFKFNEAMSIEVHCETQEEIDHYWAKLTAGGDPKAQACGWLKDKFGVSWQIVPSMVGDLFKDGQGEKSQRAFAAMMRMKKLDIAALMKAYEGK